jgi:hypothetical protein
MPRTALCLLCAGALFGVLPLSAAPEDESARKKEVLLAVQRALLKGREHLKNGHFKAAVDILERELGSFNVFENRDYLRALSEAYFGYVTELKRANQPDEAAVYQRRLASIDPGALLELRGALTAAPAPSATIVPGSPGPKSILPPLPPTVAVTPAIGTMTPGMTARGQVRDDPFDDDTSRIVPGARQLVDRAEREFDAARYEAAGRLFEQAERAAKGSTAAARERWAYCKLSGVVNALNGQGATAPQELEREVRLALSMAPKLDGIGRDLLRRIQERQGTAPAPSGTAGQPSPPRPAAGRPDDAPATVKHTPRQGNSWAMAETTHFRVLHLQSQEMAENVARVAETTRLTAARKWFGEPLAPWPARCDIVLYNTADEYSRATEQSPRCPGHSTMPMEGDRVISRRVDLHCDDPNMCVGVLPHEVTHVVLAGRFPAALPRWADEGMAVLSEPPERIERHLRNLPGHAQQGQLFPLGQLLQFVKKYPEPQQIGPFYAQSVSLVDYLSKLRGPQVFAQFLAEGMRGNFEAALRKYYSFQTYHDLDTAWQHHALGDNGAVRAASPPPP